MSSSANEKQAKGKSKRTTTTKTSKSASKGGKDGPVNDTKFRGEGTNFKCKLLGVAEVDGPRGDSMCIEAIKKLKQHIKQTGEHKPKIILNVTLKGIKILEDKSKNVLFEHPVSKVSFITHDPDDKKIFSFISSARCSSGHIGHMMYAIKYDKVAGIITSTLYELFQTVYRLRQEAAQKHRKAPPKPQTPENNSQAASSAIVSNGSNEPSSDTNIYEEPSSNVSNNLSPNSNSSHYQTPATRPLPPAPYSSQASSGSQENKENSGDTTSDQASNSSASDQFFSASVFSQPEAAASDNVSVSSVDLMRKGSISSSISSSSETTSFDSKSLDLKSGTASSTPPHSKPARSVSSVGQVVDTIKPTVTEEDENHDYETIPSYDYETIPSNLVKKTTNENETKPSFNFKESFKDDDDSFLGSFAKNKSSNSNTLNKVDPFDSSDKPEPKSTLSKESPPSSAVFSNDDFFSGHFDDKSTSANAPSTDFPVDDPFAPTLNSASQESKASEGFASSDAFAVAFGSVDVSDASFEQEQKKDVKFEGDINSNRTIKKDDTQKKESNELSINAEEPLDKEKPSEDKQIAGLSWSNAYPENNVDDKKDATSKSEPSWSANFEEDGTSSKEEKKTDEASVIFPWNDSFGTKFNDEESDRGQQPDQVSTQPDLSWTNAFGEDKPKEDVSFSWDDAFGVQKDTKDEKTEDGFGENAFTDAFVGEKGVEDGQTKVDFGSKSFSEAFGKESDIKNGQTKLDFGDDSFNDAFGGNPGANNGNSDAFSKEADAKEGQANKNFNVNSFNDAFTSPPEANNENSIKGFSSSNFDAMSTPIKPDILKSEGKDKPDVNFDGGDFPEDEMPDTKVHLKEESLDSERKAKLAEDEDFSSSDKENENDPPSEKKSTTSNTVPLIIEPPERDDSLIEEAAKPVTLPILPTKPKSDPDSPSVPPPLPPRPVSQLPSLPPRPRAISSPAVGDIPPTPPRPSASIGSPASKTPQHKRLPPALPPRIDLEMGKARANSALASSTSSTISDPFITSNSTSENDNSWRANWPSETTKANKQDSKMSPDPFGDEFFTDFNFSEAKTDTDKTDSVTSQDNFFSDPFASKVGEKDVFKADFGGVDPFADFSSKNTNSDPFSLDSKDVFSGFSTNKDPFGDSDDPFAEKEASNDPFSLSPKEDDKYASGTSFQLSKNSSDGDFADSFA